jgi:hypothetical protein
MHNRSFEPILSDRFTPLSRFISVSQHSLFIILIYVVKIIIEQKIVKTEIKYYITCKDREDLAGEIEKVDITQVKKWEEKEK